jgi:hypothetical protein
MKQVAPSFEQYIFHHARPGKNARRVKVLQWLSERVLMGVLPRLTLQTGFDTWHQFYLTMPAEHRHAAGLLWREYLSYRYNHRKRKARPKRRYDLIRTQRLG